jgi:hypothetical protein
VASFEELDEAVEMLEAFKKHAAAKAGIEAAYASKDRYADMYICIYTYILLLLQLLLLLLLLLLL